MESVTIQGEFIRLQELLKLTGAADTGGEAKLAIQNGEASVNGTECRMRGKKLRDGDTVTFRGRTYAVRGSVGAEETEAVRAEKPEADGAGEAELSPARGPDS